MALCVDIQRALHQRGCFVQMTNGPGMYPHSHFHSGVELIFVHAGGARISTEGLSITALPGSVTVIPGEFEHSTQSIHQQFRRTVIHASDELFEVYEKLQCLDSHRHSVGLSADAFDRCFWAARQLYMLTMPQKQPWTKVLKKLVDLIGTELEVAWESAQDLSENNNAMLAEIINYMAEHLDHPEELTELARHFGISERHLCRVFNSELGYSPQRYWLQLRLERACQLLSTQASIAEITQLVGFESVRGFQRAFQRSFGIPPSHYNHNHT